MAFRAATRIADFLRALPEAQTARALHSQVEATGDLNLRRLSMEYLPLAFSRRHGDPTRPWNAFSIELKSGDGRTNLNYQGNWRDIFQNWEALAVSFPEFLTAMICRFVNATTADGYNPYRVTKDGFDWEVPEPDDPWANIGYWGDHQIIYLQKLLEWSRAFYPNRLQQLLNSPEFVYADVPYRIKNYDEIQKDPCATIEFDFEAAEQINERVEQLGADGKLLHGDDGEVLYVTLVEKLLTLSLAKLSNFVPDGGIWLNTQRPEWNDANNALVGNGLSMVTACYLRRWFSFVHELVSVCEAESFAVSAEVMAFLNRVVSTLEEHSDALSGRVDSQLRRTIVDELSKAGSDYRATLYASGLNGTIAEISKADCLKFFDMARRVIESTIRTNKRSDGLYHAYNLLDLRDDKANVDHLYEMLEGQVAVLSAGLLSPEEAVCLLDTLRSSVLYRENQDSYILYPDRRLPRFLQKNDIAADFVESNTLLRHLLDDGDETIVSRDVHGGVHFSGRFRNSADVRAAVDELDTRYLEAAKTDGEEVVRHFHDVFDHRCFTGRSGTFFAYEGLGSIYWHMVSKLGLAVSEIFFSAVTNGARQETIDALRQHFYAIRRGIGAEKSPMEYGAFPTDPYSHTPENAGVKQPGMTGQVKEDVLARFSEIGVYVKDGCLGFRLDLFDFNELLQESDDLTFYDISGVLQSVTISESEFGFTLCQVPIVYQSGESDVIRVHRTEGQNHEIAGLQLDEETSQQLFSRSGTIKRIDCCFRTLHRTD